MEQVAFNGIKKVISLYNKENKIFDEDVKLSLDVYDEVVRSGGKGFHEINKEIRTVEEISNLLSEHGRNLDKDKVELVVKIINERSARDREKNVFIIQVIISILVVVGVVTSFYIGHVNEIDKKYLTGLIGTIVGFWLK